MIPSNLIKALGFLLLCSGVACTTQESSNANENNSDTLENQTMKEKDIHSYSNPTQISVTHLNWEAEVDFENKRITAKAILDIDIKENSKTLLLDTHSLTIQSVTDPEGTPLAYSLGEQHPIFGQSMEISLEKPIKSVVIEYTTSPDSQALLWLDPAQTADKVAPFLFTQSQSILARSWIPLQDSPGVRFTYSAKVTVPKHLLPVMSASNPQEKNTTGVYEFEMKQAIPSYLMALAVGDLAFKSIGTRTGVYAEKSVVDKAAYEFEDIESMIEAAEALYGPYAWDRYDILVLPPSFPFGGMENPRLTFATPTILAGDKSLVSLVAHELAHSWSGNLVTNATWNDFWLNEGFTVYFENRIMESVYGKEYSEMLATLSYQDLNAEITSLIESGHPEDTELKLNLEGRSSDDGMTLIAYDKGYLFLRNLEELVGREKFDAFLKNYFSENAFSVMDTERFLAILDAKLFEENSIEKPEGLYENWVYGQGLPAEHPVPTSDKFSKVSAEVTAWQSGKALGALSTKEWTTHEWLHFLRGLPKDLSIAQMEALDAEFGFTESGNSEITMAWLLHVIDHQYTKGYEKLNRFLIETGRRKFLTPLYKAMLQEEGGKAMALEIYEKARPNYHFVATNTMDALLEYKP